ncbi:hypothetical protein GCM10027040_04330 [Halomonas shantousis]
MSGFFRRFFPPRWQHRDPEVRCQAVARLDPQQDEDMTRLEQLASDPDARVRRAALARIEDPERLLALLPSHGSQELRERLLQLLCGGIETPSLALRQSLIAHLDDQELLNTVALKGDNLQLRLAALERLESETDLIRQASDNGIAAVRHAAAERITSETGLAQLAREARRDKQVARLARERLNRMRADEADAEAMRVERQRILEAMEAQARQPWEPLYAARYRHLLRAWETLADAPSAEQEQRFYAASQRCHKIMSDHETEGHALAEQQRQRDDAAQARQALIETLEDTLEGLRRSRQLSAQDVDTLRAQRRLHSERWQTLSDRHPPDAEIAERYTRALHDIATIIDAWDRADAHAEELRQALEGPREELEASLARLAWPEELPPPSGIARARERLQQQQSPAATPATDTQALRDDLEQLEAQLDRGAFKDASRLYRSLRQRFDHLDAASRQAHEATLKRQGARLAELRDWRGFVAGPKRTQLIEAIEALAADTGTPEAERDRRHRQLVKEWKSLGDAATTAELATQFRAASDRIHAQLAPWREALDAKRQQHLEAREALCEQLEALLSQPNPEADPDALRQIRDRAREQWQRLTPVPRDQARAIGQRFGKIRHELQRLIDQRAGEIAAAKRELIEQARELLASDSPAARRAEQAKTLQNRWRTLGRAPKGEEQLLWREFRSLCDHIFAARDAEREDRTQRAQQRLDAMQALIERLDAWQPTRSDEHAVLDTAIAEAEALEPLPGRRSIGMRRRWQGIIRTRRERLERLALAEQAQHWGSWRELIESHVDADTQALAGHSAADVALGASLPDDARRAHALRNAARTQRDQETALERLAQLRVYLALLAGDPIEPSEEPLRLQVQVSRLNDGWGQPQRQAEELRGVLLEILATGPIDRPSWDAQLPRMASLLQSLALHEPGQASADAGN